MKKNLLRSYICLLLAIVMTVGMWGCAGETVPPNNDVPQDGGTTTPEGGNTTPDGGNTTPDNGNNNPDGGNTTPEGGNTTPDSGNNNPDGGNTEEDPPVQSVQWTIENLKKAKIVYPGKTYAAGGQVETALDNLILAIKSRFACELPKTIDQVLPNHATYCEYEYEIVVGETKRDASKKNLTDLLQADWGYVIDGTKIVIKGGSQEALVTAINNFRGNVVNTFRDAKLFYKNSLDKLTRVNRLAKDLVINGTHISEFTIVYPAKGTEFEKELARRLSDHIAGISGHILPFKADSTVKGAHEILVGKTNREFSILTTTGAAVEADSKYVVLVGSNAYDYGLAQEALCELMEQAASAKEELKLPDKTPVAGATEKISMMSYNVYGFKADTTRCDNICRLVTKYLPDILGYQEPDLAMTNKIRMSNYYEWFDGKPRYTKADGTNVSDGNAANSISPIAYAKDRFEFILGDTKWTTGTPDEPSKSPESKHYRMYTYAMLRDKITGEEFIVVNHHLQGDIASEQLTYMFKFFQENYTDIPVIMLGDFNSEVGTDAIKRVVVQEGGFTSLHNMSVNPESNKPARIDWIFAMSCCVQGHFYKWCQETYPDTQAYPDYRFGDGKYPSDHQPVYVELSIKSDRTEHTHDWSKLASVYKWIKEPTVPQRAS